MYSVAVTSVNTLEVVEVPKPEPGPYDVIVETEIAFVCNLSDRKVVEGHMPGLDASNYPLLLGHESVGRVVETGKSVQTFAVGDRAIGGLVLDVPGGDFGSGWGGNSEFTVIKDHHAMAADGVADEAHGWNEVYKIMTKVPDDISVEAAGLLCTWREVYSGLTHDFRLGTGDDIVVFGCGPVGLSHIRFAKLLGFGFVAGVDPLPNKRELALKMGADAVFDVGDSRLADTVEQRGRKLDAVLDAVGLESIMNAGLPLIRTDGKICVFGVVGADTVTLQKHAAPYNFQVLFHQWPTRDAEAAAQEPLVEWIRSGQLDPDVFVTGRFSVDEFEAAYEATKAPTNIKTLVRFDRA